MGAALSNIPWDVFCEISRYLTSQELVFLAAVSKPLRQIFYGNRSIWFYQVARLIHTESLVPYSFDLRNADASVLRDIATRSFRLMFSMQRKWSEKGEPFPDFALESSEVAYIREDAFKEPFQYHRLLPGGRWLLTGGSDDESGRLCCWDLDNTTKPPVVHEFRHRLAVFDGLEGDDTAVVCQSSFGSKEVFVMARTCSGEGDYDIDILRLSWKLDEEGDGKPEFEHLARYLPKGVFIEGAYLVDDLACFGSASEWFIWNWREDKVAKVVLTGTPVSLYLSETLLQTLDVIFALALQAEAPGHLVFHDDHFFAISKDGRISMFALPQLGSASDGFVATEKPKPLATSVTFGTLREAATLMHWMNPRRRPASLMCLKTTIVPMSAHASNETGSFASPAILFDFSPTTDDEDVQARPEDLFPSSDTDVDSELPRVLYRGRGSLDLHGVLDLFNGMLVERTSGLRRRRSAPSVPKPHIWIDLHHLSRDWQTSQTTSMDPTPSSEISIPTKVQRRRRINPFPSALVLETQIPFDMGPGGEEELKQGLDMCYSSGRVVIVRPRARSVEIFEFK